MNCFEPRFSILTGGHGFNDYFKFHIYACNYVGISITIMGYGVSADVRIYDPSRRSKSDSKDTHEE